MKKWGLIFAALIAVLYLGTVITGIRLKKLSFRHSPASPQFAPPWQPPARSTIPAGEKGDSIRTGERIFNETSAYASAYAVAKLSCDSCHAAGGIQPWASPMVGVAGTFPMYSKRAGRMISLRDRIQECFVRSENGKPLSYNAPEMDALVNYIGWLSQPQPARRQFEGRGFETLSDLTPNATRGASVYAEQCAGCHGRDGAGSPPMFPPLWGAESFNDGAGMNDIAKMARFVHRNMPQNRMGILSEQDAYDVAAFIHAQPRPKFNIAFAAY
jgi:thiosulfate dehydrogenase